MARDGALFRRRAERAAAAGEPRRASAGVLERLWRSERGTALVEFALVAPVLLLLVFGILDFARALNYYNDLTQLVGQGARAAAVDRSPDGTTIGTDARCTGFSNNSIQCQLVKTYTATGELEKGIRVCIPSTAAPGSPVTVTASYAFNFIPFIASKLGAASITLTASQTERQEATATYGAGCISGP